MDPDQRLPNHKTSKTAFPKDLYIGRGALKESSLKSRAKEKNDAGASSACIMIIRVPTSIIELQCELYVPGRLGTCDLSHRVSQAHVGRIVLDVIESVNEVGSKLQAEALGNRKVFMQAQIYVGVTRRAK